jgi:hypothetical protein
MHLSSSFINASFNAILYFYDVFLFRYIDAFLISGSDLRGFRCELYDAEIYSTSYCTDGMWSL